jgi:methionine-rich copper-binding protein CopC
MSASRLPDDGAALQDCRACGASMNRWKTTDRFTGVARAGMVFALLLALPHGAFGHAIIVSSQPAAGETVTAGPLPIHLRFNSRIDHSRSRLTLLAPDGTQQTLAATPGSPPDGFDAEANPSSAGQWRLRWQVLSVDGHITRGDIPFGVR